MDKLDEHSEGSLSGRFDDFDTAQTAMALSAYALGIPAYVGVKVLNAAYFARQDTASPVRIAFSARPSTPAAACC